MRYLQTISATSDSTAVAAAGDYVVGSESGHGVEWVDGQPRPLSGDNSEPAGVNRFGEIAGTESMRPAVWVNGSRTDLPIPTTAIGGEARAVTDHREIGGSLFNHGGPVTWTYHAPGT